MLNNTSVKMQRLRYVVPFTVKEAYDMLPENDEKNKDGTESSNVKRMFTFESIVERIDNEKAIVKGNTKNVWKRITISDDNAESDLYKYVRDEFRFDDEALPVLSNKSGVNWIYDLENGDSIIELKYLKDQSDYKGKYYVLTIKDMGLYLFDNGILFLWYEIDLPKKIKIPADELVDLQYQIKELNRKEHISLWEDVKEENGWGYSIEKYNDNAPAYRRPVLLGEFINDKIAFLNPLYFAERKSAFSSMIKGMEENAAEKGINFKSPYHLTNAEAHEALLPDKALLFSYVVTDDNLEDDEELAFYLANGYKDSYKLSEYTRAAMAHPFDNVTWYATKEGCVYLAKVDNSNEAFFTSTMPSKITGDYFSLYIKALFQSYSLLLYAQKIQKEISTDYRQYLNEPIDEEITHLYAEINLFLTNSMATSVSHIHQQSEFFCYLKEQLRIHDDIKSITSGIEAIDSLQREERLRIEEEKRRAEEKAENDRDAKMQSIMGLFALLGIGSALIDSWDFIIEVREFFTGRGNSMSLIVLFIQLVVIVVILRISFLAADAAIRALRENGEELWLDKFVKLFKRKK